MYKRVIFGAIGNDKVAALTDVDTREKSLLFCLASLVLILGVWPDPLLEMMSASVEHLVTHISQSKLP